jgi:hypothetical protein
MLRRMLADAMGLLRARPAAPSANPLAEYFRNNPGRLIDKWHHYFEIYHRHFAAFRGRSPVVVEIGVYHGGSLEMWRHYFGRGARIVGIDLDPRCRQFEADSVNVMIGDQADRGFLSQVRARFPHVDIVIDDGGHTMAQQITSFEELYPHIQPHGVYLCEDLHTSYYPPAATGKTAPSSSTRRGSSTSCTPGIPPSPIASGSTRSRAPRTACTSTTACWWWRSGRSPSPPRRRPGSRAFLYSVAWPPAQASATSLSRRSANCCRNC